MNIKILKNLFAIFLIVLSSGAVSKTIIFAENGVVDFSEHESINEKFEVLGDVFFYPGQFLDPIKATNKKLNKEGVRVKLPHYWGKGKMDNEGSGTYVITVKNLPIVKVGIILDLRTAYKAHFLIDKRVVEKIQGDFHH